MPISFPTHSSLISPRITRVFATHHPIHRFPISPITCGPCALLYLYSTRHTAPIILPPFVVKLAKPCSYSSHVTYKSWKYGEQPPPALAYRRRHLSTSFAPG